MEDSIGLPVVSGFLTVELGSFKDTMKTDGSDLSKCCAVLQRSCAKDDKISTSNMMVDTSLRFTENWSGNENSF